jgi:hypothetical protein
VAVGRIENDFLMIGGFSPSDRSQWGAGDIYRRHFPL